MKKLAILIATLLIVCLMACACGTTPEDSTSESTQESTQASTQASTQTSQNQGDTNQGGGNQGTVTPPPAAGEIIDFGTATELTSYQNANGDTLDANVTVGDFTLLPGVKVYRKGPKNSDDTKYAFNAYAQVGKDANAGYGTKSIQFSATGAGTLTVYANRASTSVSDASLVQLHLVSDSAPVAVEVLPNNGDKAYCVTFAIPAAGNYAICGDGNCGFNIFGIGFTAA